MVFGVVKNTWESSPTVGHFLGCLLMSFAELLWQSMGFVWV